MNKWLKIVQSIVGLMALGFLPARNFSWHMIFLILKYLSELALEQLKHRTLKCVLQDHL